MYCRVIEQNLWARAYLPNAGAQPAPIERRGSALVRPIGTALEAVLSGSLGARLERWEMNRKVGRLQARRRHGESTLEFGPDCCRGHFGNYQQRTLEAFAGRRQSLGLPRRPTSVDERAR